MKTLIILFLLISCSQAERRISSSQEHQDQLQVLFEATPKEHIRDRHEFQRMQREPSYYVCKRKDKWTLATEPTGVQAAFSIRNKFEACRLITKAEYHNHQ